MSGRPEYSFYQSDWKSVAKQIGKEGLLASLEKMVLIRNFERRAEAEYQQGNIGGFFHSYMGQEAIQTACTEALGKDHWYTTTYRCHALALLLGATPNEIMAELFGKTTGNAQGRGGSMHLYEEKLLGGFGIVGGHLPIATGAGFSLKYQEKKDLISICFLGDGAVVQGAVHESFNLASLWNLPCLYVIENNQWGMGTAVNRAVCIQPIAENMSKAYGIESYTLDGMDFFNCYAAFLEICEKIKKTSRPLLIEVVTERFRGHSISDPGLYRSKEDLKKSMEKDPIELMKQKLIELGYITQQDFETMDKQCREAVIQSIEFAKKSPNPDPAILEEGVFAPEDRL